MIRHIVLIKFRPEVAEADIAAMFADLAAIRDRVPGFLDMRFGRSESPEKLERGYMHGFTIDFEDWAALHSYLEHPDHKAAGGRLIAHAEGGLDGILVVDIDV